MIMGFFSKLRKGLEKTKHSLIQNIETVVRGYAKIDDDMYDDLEAVMLTGDMGVETTEYLLNQVLTGVSKTTTIGKLAKYYEEQGKSVMLAAGDTFRAAASEQLTIWAERVGAPIVKHQEGADAAAVVFDATASAKARNIDILLVDTAGRLQTKSNLMEELRKMARIAGRNIDGAPQETLLVLDATTGQNAVSQAKLFGDVVPLTGVVLSIKRELGVPVRWVGVGEGVDDLRPFDAAQFADALFDKNVAAREEGGE